MTPFDLPPDNPADWFADDLRRPAEVRKAYLSKPPDDELRDHDAEPRRDIRMHVSPDCYALTDRPAPLTHRKASGETETR
jgi:hypothetical protein